MQTACAAAAASCLLSLLLGGCFAQGCHAALGVFMRAALNAQHAAEQQNVIAPRKSKAA